MYLGFHINIKQHNIDYSLAPNQQIRMFSEGSYNTDDLSNNAENSAFPSQE